MAYKPLVFLTFCLALSGCGTTVVQHTQPDPADIQLAEAANSVSHSLNMMAETEQAQLPQQKITEPPRPDSYGMGDKATLDWTGPVAPLIKQLAKSTGYKARILGHAPAIPVLVSISAKNTSIGDVVRDVGFQCGPRANIVIFPATRVIELRYAQT